MCAVANPIMASDSRPRFCLRSECEIRCSRVSSLLRLGRLRLSSRLACCELIMPTIGHSERVIGKVSATFEITCLECECSSITDLLQIQPTWTSPVHTFGSPEDPLIRKTG